jgi:hypothetical protein
MKKVSSYMSGSGRSLKDNFIRNNYQATIDQAKRVLSIKGKRYTSWIGYAKIMIQVHNRFGSASGEWKRVSSTASRTYE